MKFEDILATAFKVAQQLGLISSWQVWALFFLLVLAEVWWHTIGWKIVIKPGWDPEKGTGPLSPPMDMPEGGAVLHQEPPKDNL